MIPIDGSNRRRILAGRIRKTCRETPDSKADRYLGELPARFRFVFYKSFILTITRTQAMGFDSNQPSHDAKLLRSISNLLAKHLMLGACPQTLSLARFVAINRK
jgi:hypothetical protein